jgi:hypothetical protein
LRGGGKHEKGRGRSADHSHLSQELSRCLKILDRYIHGIFLIREFADPTLVSFPAVNFVGVVLRFSYMQLGKATPLPVQLVGQTLKGQDSPEENRMPLILLSERDTAHTFWGNSPNRCSAQELAQEREVIKI